MYNNMEYQGGFGGVQDKMYRPQPFPQFQPFQPQQPGPMGNRFKGPMPVGYNPSEPFMQDGAMTGGVMRPAVEPPETMSPAVMPEPVQFSSGPFRVGGARPQPQQQPQYQQQPMNSFMGYGGFNPYQQMNPFMGGGGFNPFMGMMGGYGGYGGFNPFMGGMGYGGFGGFNPYQQMNPFMGGYGGMGGMGGMGGYSQPQQFQQPQQNSAAFPY